MNKRNIKRHEISRKYLTLMRRKLRPELAQVFGYHALLYTAQAEDLCHTDIVIKHQVVIDPEGEPADIHCRFEEMAIASDSIDLVVLPNILQNTAQPHQVLREVERILIPEGVAIIIGQNPYSWYGIKQRFLDWRSLSQSAEADISRRRVNDWFNLLGFETEQEINLSMTCERIQKSQLSGWLKLLSQFICDRFCHYYIIVAKKKVSTLTPIRPSWRKNKQLVPPRLAEPSVRMQVEDWFDKIDKPTK